MIAYLPKEKLEFEIRENCKDDKDVLFEMFGENIYRIGPERFSEGGGVVLDIGANIGAFSIQACSLVSNIHVVSIEPEVHNYDLLNGNIRRNAMKDLIHPYLLAVGKGAYVHMSDEAGSSKATEATTGTSCMTIQELLDKIRHELGFKEFDVLKVDIEGGEYELFSSISPERLKAFKFITMEFHATNALEFGILIASLTQTHSVDIIGSFDKGGNIYAYRYE